MIERTELMSIRDMIDWLKVLGDGYAKPDMNKDNANKNTTGIVRETKNYMRFIEAINENLCEKAGIDCSTLKAKNYDHD